jgi:hypothetical protein
MQELTNRQLKLDRIPDPDGDLRDRATAERLGLNLFYEYPFD